MGASFGEMMKAFDISIPKAVWVDTDAEAEKWLEYFVESSKTNNIGLDSETTGVEIHKDTVVVWSLSDGKERICLPARYLQMYRYRLLENPNVTFDLSNCKFDAHMFANSGVEIYKCKAWRDTNVMSWLLNENNIGRQGLKECIEDHFGRKTPTFTEVFGKTKKATKKDPVELKTGDLIRSAFNDPVRREIACDYASLDAYNSTTLRAHFDVLLQKAGLYSLYYDVEVPFHKVLWLMERRGITADYGFLNQLQGPMEEEMKKIEHEFNKHAGRELNLNSVNDVRWFFIDHLQKNVVKMTKGGKTGIKKASTDEEVLKHWAEEEGDEWAQLLMTHRGISKIHGTYVTGLQEWIDGRFRIHTTLNQHGTVSGRLSSKDPNLQNIPRTSEDAFTIREAFIAGFKKCLVVADYAQLEMRLMAHFSRDEKMIKAIWDGVDLHCLTVSEMHGIPYEEVIAAVKAEKKHKRGTLGRNLTPREIELLFMRQSAKATGFGIIYGIAGKRLSVSLTQAAKAAHIDKIVTEDEGYALIDKWFGVFPRVKEYIEETHDYMLKYGFVQTITGRYRRFGDVKGMSFKDRNRAERQGVNSIIQGSAADIAKVVMIHAENDEVLRNLNADLLLQVHDELIWECPDDPASLEAVKTRVKELMEAPFQEALLVPLPAEVGHGYSWATAK
ncbi:MAG: hypothetical protein E6R04_03905 [Spirochaetes bacterium]|nr:MAG: hypothetical protein E6R04_03905 [Spirochaetota bacterium]